MEFVTDLRTLAGSKLVPRARAFRSAVTEPTGLSWEGHGEDSGEDSGEGVGEGRRVERFVDFMHLQLYTSNA